MATGSDSFILAATTVIIWAAYGCEVATWLRLRNEEEKSMALGYAISNMVGGVGEPFIYGMMFRYRRLFPCLMAGSFVAGAIAIALGVTVYVAGGASNVLNVLVFVGGSTSNLVNMGISASAGFVTSFILTFMFGFTKDELEYGPAQERV